MKKFVIILFLFATSLFAQNSSENKTIITLEDKMEILDSLNKYRVEAGLSPFRYSFEYENLSRQRTQSIKEHLDTLSKELFMSDSRKALHFNFKKDICFFNSVNLPNNVKFGLKGECSAIIPPYIENEECVEKFFNGWKNSQPHWEAIMNEEFTFVTIDWIETKNGIVASLNLFYLQDHNPELPKRICEK
jgi:uncharacterized protein YkwD